MLKENVMRRGRLSAHLIDPLWKWDFPYHWPVERWPVKRLLFEKQNQITTAGQNRSYTNGFDFTYIAGGIGVSNPKPEDTQLLNELQRFLVEDLTLAPGQIQAFATIPSGTGNQTWREWGVFMGDAETGVNTGTMYSRIAQQFTKQVADSVLLTYTLIETVQNG